jgi:hypothetical protein
MFLFLMFPAFLSLFLGLCMCRSGQRTTCAALWALSLVASNISAYLAVSPYAPGLWLALALGAPLICVIFALHSRFARPSQNRELEASYSPRSLRRLKIATLALSLLPIVSIVIAKFHMTQFDASMEDCKQTFANALLAKNTAHQKQKIKLTCSAPHGFNATSISSDSLVYTGNLVGQQVFLDAHQHEGSVSWECHVYPKIFGNRTCKGYEIVWH